jgi:hypothetical protein
VGGTSASASPRLGRVRLLLCCWAWGWCSPRSWCAARTYVAAVHAPAWYGAARQTGKRSAPYRIIALAFACERLTGMDGGRMGLRHRPLVVPSPLSGIHVRCNLPGRPSDKLCIKDSPGWSAGTLVTLARGVGHPPSPSLGSKAVQRHQNAGRTCPRKKESSHRKLSSPSASAVLYCAALQMCSSWFGPGHGVARLAGDATLF